MFGKDVKARECASIESKLVAYLDRRAQPAERRVVEEHLAACAACRLRADEFQSLWGALDDLPEISPSPSFDASLRARIAAEPVRRRFWRIVPSPRLAFAVTVLVAMSIWLSSSPRMKTSPSSVAETSHNTPAASADSDFGMIQNLPVLENYDVVSKFDALSELNVPPDASAGEGARETR